MYKGLNNFDFLVDRLQKLSEGKVSPYVGAHPAFGGITSKMRAGGLSSAPLDTIKFIREILYYLDIIDDNELNAIKKAPGFSGKKKAMLQTLKTKQREINAKSNEISERVSDTLDDFINGVSVNRGREEKYAAQAAALEISKQMRQTRSGKQMDDALTDLVADESLLVKTAVAKILADIQKNLGEPGFDIEEEALSEVIDFSSKINSLADLKSFISQISTEPGYEKIAAYLSSAVKPISQGTEDEEMIEDEESYSNEATPEDGEVDPESFYDPTGSAQAGEEDYDDMMSSDLDSIYKQIDDIVYSDYDSGFHYMVDDEGTREANPDMFKRYNELVKKAVSLTGGDGPAHKVDPMKYGEFSDDYKDIWNYRPRFKISYNEMMEWYKNIENEKKDARSSGQLNDSYTHIYLPKETVLTEKNTAKTVSFKEKYTPKTSFQLEELRRYGL